MFGHVSSINGSINFFWVRNYMANHDQNIKTLKTLITQTPDIFANKIQGQWLMNIFVKIHIIEKAMTS